MNKSARDNETIIQKLELINGTIDSTLKKIDKLNEQYCEKNEPIIKEKLLGDLTLISNNLNDSMRNCDTIFKKYICIPCSTKNLDLPDYLSTEKNINVIDKDKEIAEKYQIDGNQLYEIDIFKENCNKLCTYLSEKLREYNKKNKKIYMKNQREENINNLIETLQDYHKKFE
jgi:hypothetical protein